MCDARFRFFAAKQSPSLRRREDATPGARNHVTNLSEFSIADAWRVNPVIRGQEAIPAGVIAGLAGRRAAASCWCRPFYFAVRRGWATGPKGAEMQNLALARPLATIVVTSIRSMVATTGRAAGSTGRMPQKLGARQFAIGRALSGWSRPTDCAARLLMVDLRRAG